MEKYLPILQLIASAFLICSTSSQLYVNGESSNVYRSYNKGTYCSTSSPTQTPRSVAEVQEIVSRAAAAGQKVKAIGNLGSNTDIICTDGIPLDMRNFNYTRINEDLTAATAGAGTQFQEFLEFLETKGRTLLQVPSYGGITVGGALGAPSSGSSLRHAGSVADLATQVTIVDGQGALRIISDPAELSAFRMNLGLLGILIDVTFQTAPLFKMSVENSRFPDSILTDGTALRWAQTYDYLSLFWFPSSSSVIASKGTFLQDLTIPGNASTYLIPDEPSSVLTLFSTALEGLQATENRIGLAALQKFIEVSLHKKVVGRPAVFSEDGGNVLRNPATGTAWRLLMNRCSNKCSWDNGNFSLNPEESNVSADVSSLSGVVEMMADVFRKVPAYNYMIGVFFRFSSPSDTLLSPAFGRQTFSFDLVSGMRRNPFQTARSGLGAYQAILQSMVNDFGGRPHWGKNGLYFTSRDVIQKTTSSSRLESFKGVREKYDPSGTFLNKFGLRLLNVSNEMSKDPRVARCALQDFCVCSVSSDCAPLQTCSSVNSYKVCRDVVPSIPVPLVPLAPYDPSNLLSFILNALNPV